MPSSLATSTAPRWLSHKPWIRFLAFAAVATVATAVLAQWNVPVFLWIQSHLSPDHPTAWSAVTVLGSGVGIAAILSPVWRWRRNLGPAMLVSAALCALVVQLIKRLAVAPRPLSLLGPDLVQVIGMPLYGRSFPSGHAAAAFTCAAVLITARLAGPRWHVVILAAAASIALSRVVTGAHWPSDLLAGACIGWACGVVGYRLAERLPQAVRHHLEWVAGVVLFGCGVALVVTDQGYPLALGYQRFFGIATMAVTAVTLFEQVIASNRVRI